MRRVIKMRCIKTKSDEQGAVLVEMAFALPLLGLIFLSILDLGFIVREHQLLQNAAREAARFSAHEANSMLRLLPAQRPAKLVEIKQFAVRYAAQEGIVVDPNNVSVNQGFLIPGNCGSEITITYPRSLFLLGRPLIPINAITITGRAVFYNLYGGCYAPPYP